jgi:aminopeptidase N
VAREITRDECARRAELLRVRGYDLTLDMTAGDWLFRSTSVITFDCTEPGAATHADLVASRVFEITLNGVPIDPDHAWENDRIALDGLAAHNELRVVAECRYARDGTGLHRFTDPADGCTYTYTKFEPAYARTVFACFEQPDLKAPFTITVRAPAHWTVLSNQPPTGPGERATDGARTWRYPPTKPLSTYLVAVVAGEYHVLAAEHTTPRGQRIPLRLAWRASLAEWMAAEDLLDSTRRGLDYFTGLFERDYPFAKYDQVFVPEFSAGATESAACVVLSDRLLFRSRVTDAMRELRTSVVLHEMAHMWFGDLVTMRWWDDLWLNESFAEYCAALASAEATRYRSAWATFSAGRKVWGYQADRLPSSHPVAADVPTLSAAIANFDGISYAKGASVLQQLVATIGRDAFFAGIREYFARHQWGNATLSDLLAALARSSGSELSGWAQAWLTSAGPSLLAAQVEVGAAGSFRSVEVAQRAASGDEVLRPHWLRIGLFELDHGRLVRTHGVPVQVAGAVTPVPALTGLARPDLLLLNDEDLTYALVRFDDRSLHTLESSIGLLDDEVARAVCWTSVIDMVRQAELAVPVFLGMVARAMATEPSVRSLQILLAAARDAVELLAAPSWVAAGRALLADQAAPLLRAALPGSDHQLAWAQLLCWTAVSPSQLELLGGLLNGSLPLDGLVVDAELRWEMLRRLCATGLAGDAEVSAELQRDRTDTGARHAAACQAARPVADAKAAAWSLLTEREQPVDTVLEVAGAFYQPEQAELLAPYVSRYFDVLPRVWATRGGHLRVRLAEALFPRTAAGPELLSRLDAFVAREDVDPGLARVLAERRYLVERALHSRALPG